MRTFKLLKVGVKSYVTLDNANVQHTVFGALANPGKNKPHVSSKTKGQSTFAKMRMLGLR